MSESYSESLKDFFENNIFKAESMMTPIQSLVSIEKNASKKEVEDRIAEAQEKHISSIVISEGKRPIGYSVIPSSTRRLKNYDPRTRFVRFNEQNYLSSGSTLGDIVSKFLEVASSIGKSISPPIFLVYDSLGGKDMPIGLMTYWDLNRRSVYSYLYAIFVYFEQSMKLEIYFSHSNDLYKCILEYIKTKDLRKRHPRVIGPNASDLGSNISKLKFEELKELLYDEHSSPDVKITFPEEIIAALKDKRNQLAHPVNLIIESGLADIRRRLETLYKICVNARDIVIKYDRNTKNTMHSPPINEIDLQ